MRRSSADGEMNTAASLSTQDRANRRGAAWVWWGLLAAFVGVVVLSVVGVVKRGNHGIDENRGPATEAAPGAEPTRDIDRSRAP